MTRDEKIAAIRAACVEANPAILKLDFGCLVRVGRITRGSFSHCVLPGEGLHRDTFICVGRCRPPTESKLIFQHQIGFCHVDETEVAKFHEIIGHPIRIADVLLALQRQIQMVYVDRWGVMEYYPMGQDRKRSVAVQWNLHRDSLDEQDDPCIDFLADLLPPKS